MVMDASDVSALKKDLRGEFRERCRRVGPVQKAGESAAVIAHLRRLLCDLGAVHVASFLALPDEIDLSELHRERWYAGLSVFLPRVLDPQRLVWHPVRSFGEVRPGTFAILEPDPELVPSQPLPAGTVVLTPGLAFGADGRRLGRGKGYYDRALANVHLTAIGVGFALQRCDTIPIAAHDRTLDGVILGDAVLRAPATGGGGRA